MTKEKNILEPDLQRRFELLKGIPDRDLNRTSEGLWPSDHAGVAALVRN